MKTSYKITQFEQSYILMWCSMLIQGSELNSEVKKVNSVTMRLQLFTVNVFT